MRELDEEGPGAPTIAFQASGIEGIKVRITVKDEPDAADARLAREEQAVREVLGVLTDLRLVPVGEHGVRGLPAAHRYRAAVARRPAPLELA